ncbi:MAG: aminodeoxychorismate lyase [Rheinheimera sp.]|nr:aminodeoxychorismate lyase [Rheinheimera sp.]
MQIQFSDRSFQYGDAIFSTVRIRDGQPQLWSLHWQRLRHSMQRLGFAALDETTVLQQVQANITAPEQVLKVLISRGEGARGYGTLGISIPQLYCWTAPLPDYHRAREYGVRLGLAQMRLAQQPILAGIKHCSRLETVMLKREAEQSGFDDLLVCDQQDFLIEATAANLLLWRDGQWWTPDLQQAGVAGVMRQLLLDTGLVTIRLLPLADIEQASAMALCNALTGIVPVSSFAGQPLPMTPAIQLQQQVDVLLQDR